jgi:hypothetical protein
MFCGMKFRDLPKQTSLQPGVVLWKITVKTGTISIHRKTQQIGRRYISEIIGKCDNVLEKNTFDNNSV